MSELSKTPKPYQMETEIIPAGVNLELAKQRTALIEQFRGGVLEGHDAYRALEHLYWDNQHIADDITRGYLRETSYAFPVEADLPEEEASAIYLEVQEQY